MIHCFLLAGGLGTRVRSLHADIPKALIPIGGKPFLFHQLKGLEKGGVDRVSICIGHLGEQIRAFVDRFEQESPLLKIDFIEEGKELLGTAGALRQALEVTQTTAPFLVTWGDSFLPIEFSEVLKSFDSTRFEGLMTVFRNHGKWDKSNVLFENGRITLYDKWNPAPAGKSYDFIDYGLMAFHPKTILSRVPKNKKADLAELCHELSVLGKLQGLEAKERFYEIGSPQGIKELNTLHAEVLSN